MQDQGEVGLTQLQQGMAALQAAGLMIERTLGPLLLAEPLGPAGQVMKGQRLLAEALMAFETGGRGDMLTEVYRLQGEFLQRQDVPDVALADVCFQQALTVARRQQAKSWELRAAMSLARLWQSQDKRQEAYDLLAPIYGWFTEGFNTADLLEAKALLDALA
jgi:predicted ATPase